MLGHSKSAPEFSLYLFSMLFVPEHLYFIYRRGRQGSSGAGKSQITLPKASAVPKAGERSRSKWRDSLRKGWSWQGHDSFPSFVDISCSSSFSHVTEPAENQQHFVSFNILSPI
jgi:hypothetical protein